MQLAALVVVEYFPLSHVAHVRFTVALGVLFTYWPALQVVQFVQLAAPAADHVPLAQARQAVSPNDEVPAAQGVQDESLIVVPAA